MRSFKARDQIFIYWWCGGVEGDQAHMIGGMALAKTEEDS